jgi:cyclic pyranopterin phosphate synthase
MKDNQQLQAVPGGTALQDTFCRNITYLRLSLTDRCNLRCLYCMTEGQSHDDFTKLDHGDLFSYEELIRVVRQAVDLGISKLRLTGGEPLLRRNVMHLVRELAAIEKLRDIRITTNGVLLARYARDLHEAGVRKVNISLDTLRRERFREITGRDYFGEVLEGIDRVLELGFSPVKLNVVVMRGINDDEIPDFARLSMEKNLQVRFIEYMPIGNDTRWREDTFVSADEIIGQVRALGELVPVPVEKADGPARLYRIGSAAGSLGVISPLSHHFCGSCNRLRLTADGKLRPCLLSDDEIDLRRVVRGGGTDEDIRETIRCAVTRKPAGHHFTEKGNGERQDCNGYMSRIGG